uniref:Protein regulator of cytokinesis 1a n=1 Tax=Monopterus albus TaxID=43700 RepID=A0A3Q3QYL4_MONAL
MPVKSQTAAFRPITSAMSGDVSNIWCLSHDRECCHAFLIDIWRQHRVGYHISKLTPHSKLCSELHLPPFEDDGGYTMLQRMEELKDLIVKDCKLHILYHAYTDHLTKEKEHLHDEFVSIKKDIVVCMDDLEQQQETSFEMDVMYGDEEAFCLSNDNISALKLLLSQLQEYKAENEVLCSIPQEEREALFEHMVKSKKKNIEALQDEIQRLEVLKMQSMKSITEAIRASMAELFFAVKNSSSTIKNYLRDWTLYLELDKKANDPSRFNNRGCNLLKEEKQRTDLQKSLPKLENSLKAQTDVWEQEYGKEFLVHRQNFLEYVQQQWDHHHTEKEREPKLKRQLKKTKQIQEDMLYGTVVRTPSQRQIAGTPTPGKARKLTGPSTISTPTTFLSAALGGTTCESSIQKPPLSASTCDLTEASKSNVKTGLLNSTVMGTTLNVNIMRLNLPYFWKTILGLLLE